MKSFPIFVTTPSGGAVAGVVSVPDGEPRGLVVSLAGTGRANVIGSTLCASLSTRLAEHGLATARLDYGSVGDSPGSVHSWTPSDVTAAEGQARAVVDVVQRALGVSRFAAVGTCYGSRVALALVEHASFVGAVCLAPPVLEYGGLTRLGRELGGRRALSIVRSNAAVRRLILAPLRRTLRARSPAPRIMGALSHLDRAQLVFLYGSPLESDHYSEQARRSVERALDRLPPGQRGRFELRLLPWGPLSNFDSLPPGDKEAVLDVVVPYVLACFDGSAVQSAAASEAVAGIPADVA